MVAMERRSSLSADRRASPNSTIGGAVDRSVAPARGSRLPSSVGTSRAGRPSILATSLGISSGDTRRPSRGGSHGVESALETEFETPSPTAARLRSLARSVRAVHTLGALKVRKRYLASAPTAAAGTANAPINIAADPASPARKVASAPAARVIVLPTHEFSTEEMRFRLDPLEVASPTASWNVHGILDAISTSAGPPSARGQQTSTSQTAANPAVLKTSRSGSTASLANGAFPGLGNAKVRWKTAATKTTHTSGSGSISSNNNNVSPTPSPVLQRGRNNSAGSRQQKRGSATNFGDNSSLFGTSGNGGLGLDSQVAADAGSSSGVAYTNIEARLCCARSLYKLSCQPGCELSIIQGGAIAQLAEFSDVDHIQLHELCAATLANLTAEPSASDAFVAHDGIPALLELSWSPSIAVKLMCITALCRLSGHPLHAAALARFKASIEFISMISLPSEQLQKLAISCIVNLVYFGHTFPDRIFLGEPHAMQNQLGVLAITSQLAAASQTMQFAAEVLFNLALYRTSCSGVLRGGGAEILHGLAVHVGRALDEHHHTSSSNMLAQQQTPRMSIASAMSLLRPIAHTLANFSAHTDFHTMMSASVMKTLMLMISGALRDLGSRFYGGLAEERLRILAVPCSRTLANMSSNDELRKQAFTPEIVQLTTKLFLVNRAKLFSISATTKLDEHSFACNVLRAVANLSFHEMCTAQVMEFPDVVPRLARVVLRSKDSGLEDDHDDQSGSSEDEDDSDDEKAEEDNGEGAGIGRRSGSQSHSADTTSGKASVENIAVTAAMQEQMKEDALVAILNLAHQGAYSHELLKHLDGKLLAVAAGEEESGSRLKYIYDVVLCNILFESRLQQIVYGDLVVNSLVDGFYFFANTTSGSGGGGLDPFTPETGSRDTLSFKTANLAFADDQARFLSAIVTITGELMDARNIDRLVTLSLDCIQPMDASITRQQRKQQRHITCYSSAILYTLARSSATRGDTNNRVYSTETVQTLIDVCERNATAVAEATPVGSTTGRAQFSYCAYTQAYCAATLYHICATGHFNERVIQALITACNSNEESLSLLACSAAFAIISFTLEGRQQLVASANLAKALNRLGRTSQVECQQYAAIAACNVSTLHCIWTSNELKDFIVVALLRANSTQAKQIHAKTLANLLSHMRTRAKAVEDGVLYALMKLTQVVALIPGSAAAEESSSVDAAAAFSPTVAPTKQSESMDEVFNLGLQVLFNLSCEHQYHQKLLGNGVISYLATAVIANKQTVSTDKEPLRIAVASSSTSPEPIVSLPLVSAVSTESRRFAMGIICNLSSFETNHKELMNAQVIDVIRSYVDHDVETRASAAMAVRNLSCRQPWVELVCERRTLQMLIGFTHCDHPVVKHFAIQALANCSQVTDSLHLFGELKVTRAVMAVLESITPTGKATARSPLKATMALPTSALLDDSRETSMAALKCLHNLAAEDALAQNLMDETAILRLLPLMESRELDINTDACFLAASMMSVLAGKPRCAEPLLKQRVIDFCALLHRKHPMDANIALECAVLLMKLSTYQPIQAALTETQAIQVVVAICSSSCAAGDARIRECGAIAIRNLTLCVTEHLSVFYGEAFYDDEELGKTRQTKARRDSRQTMERILSSRRGIDTSCAKEFPISRLTERHLMQGVDYFQQELERYLPDLVGTVTSHGGSCTHTDRILTEVCAGIANLSTVQIFRVEMVRAGVVQTLLRLFHTAQRQQPKTLIPAIVCSICSATLHRLALEEEATVDGNGLLVPSLLEILQQTDEELHQVRYECEKVSLPPNCTAASHQQQSRRGSNVTPVSSIATRKLPRPLSANATTDGQQSSQRRLNDRGSASELGSLRSVCPADAIMFASETTPSFAALVATTTCIKQNYREPKWIAYVVKTMLSSAAMVPQLEKKQIRSIGLPKLSFLDSDRASLGLCSVQPTDPTSGDDSVAKRKGGYLLSVHTDKFTAYLAACLRDGASNSGSSAGAADSYDTLIVQLSTARAAVATASARDASASHDREAMVHSRKFDRHMRLTRRNHRRTNMLPVLSFT